jgi:hypothetical protein
MSDLTLTVIPSLDAAAMARTHTVAFVGMVGDGTLRVRFTGPHGSGCASIAGSASLDRVLGILREASGLAYFYWQDMPQVAAFVPGEGLSASTPEECHARREYAVWMYTA